MTVGDARNAGTLSAAAVIAFAELHGLDNDVEVSGEAHVCDDIAAHVEIESESYHIVDSNRGLGITTLTRTTPAGTEILCHHPEF